MARYRFAVEYQGAAFEGWQIQPEGRTVQGALEQALKIALRREIQVVGSGRTDTGVHARGQVAHFDWPGDEALDVHRTLRSLNALGGPELAVRALEPCPEAFHARYSALTRRYTYRIALRPTPLHAATTWCLRAPLDVEAMRAEMPAALGEHDFVAFCIPRNDGKSTLCQVLRFDLDTEGPWLNLHIEANRFLHRMVRSLVGAVVEVGRGAAAPGLIARVLSETAHCIPPGAPFSTPHSTAHSTARPRPPWHWTWAPAQGLCLEKVTYADYDPPD